MLIQTKVNKPRDRLPQRVSGKTKFDSSRARLLLATRRFSCLELGEIIMYSISQLIQAAEFIDRRERGTKSFAIVHIFWNKVLPRCIGMSLTARSMSPLEIRNLNKSI